MEILQYTGAAFNKAKALKAKRAIFFIPFNDVPNFEKFTDDDLNRIHEMVKTWNEKNIYLSPLEIRLRLYDTLNEKIEFLDFNSYEEKLLFYLYATDPYFVFLNLYYAESNHRKIAERFKEYYGYKLEEQLIIIEKAYNHKFNIVKDEFNTKRLTK